MIKAWEDSIIKQYNNALRLWWDMNIKENTDPFDVSITKTLKFLTLRYQNGANYGTLNSSRAALLVISTENVGTNGLIKKLIICPKQDRINLDTIRRGMIRFYKNYRTGFH